jgi:hypothetical protein
MFAYCNNCPVIKSDPSGYDAATDDLNGNGIPDYLEARWEDLTEKVKAIQTFTMKAMVINVHIRERREAPMLHQTVIGEHMDPMVIPNTIMIMTTMGIQPSIHTIPKEDIIIIG